MFDIRWIRDNPDAFDDGLRRRGLEPQAQALIERDAARRKALTAAQDIQARRNALSREIGALKARGANATHIIDQVAQEKAVQIEAEAVANRLEAELDAALAELPNLPAEDVPHGPDESANRPERVVGVVPKFDFEAKEHFEIGEALGLMDFEQAAKISGARFVILKGALARLERALGAFMLDLQTTEFGYAEVAPPYLVRDAALFGTGQLPRFAEDLFVTTTEHWLIPTAEVPLTNLVRERILDEDELPLRVTALTPCFRAEAGAAGKDTRGMIRQHQFDKVELVSVTRPEDSGAEHERMTAAAEEVLKRLGLP
ncbi:MAG TPA: serine--tRNA ligase, partial [Alphaproteobacteria bacterium]